MCTTLKFINQTKNGCLTFCTTSKLFQITFNNLCFEFYEWELDNFKVYLKTLKESKWYNSEIGGSYSRKIPISVGNKYFIILVSEEELFEMAALLDVHSTCVPLLSANDIQYRFIEN